MVPYNAARVEQGMLREFGVAVWAAHSLDDGTVNVSATINWMTGIGHALGEAQGDTLSTT